MTIEELSEELRKTYTPEFVEHLMEAFKHAGCVPSDRDVSVRHIIASRINYTSTIQGASHWSDIYHHIGNRSLYGPPLFWINKIFLQPEIETT